MSQYGGKDHSFVLLFEPDVDMFDRLGRQFNVLKEPKCVDFRKPYLISQCILHWDRSILTLKKLHTLPFKLIPALWVKAHWEFHDPTSAC